MESASRPSAWRDEAVASTSHSSRIRLSRGRLHDATKADLLFFSPMNIRRLEVGDEIVAREMFATIMRSDEINGASLPAAFFELVHDLRNPSSG